MAGSAVRVSGAHTGGRRRTAVAGAAVVAGGRRRRRRWRSKGHRGNAAAEASASAQDEDEVEDEGGAGRAAPTHEGVGSRPGVDVLGDGDTIAAVVTGVGGSVGIVRISGPAAVPVLRRVFRRGAAGRGGAPREAPALRHFDADADVRSHRVYHGYVVQEEHGGEHERGAQRAGAAPPPPPPQIVDEVLALVMRGPRSYTCEDVVEIHTHGGALHPKRVLDMVLRGGAAGAARAARARMAHPGEFTYRAFMNGRIDLTQAEAVAAAVSARTVRQADMAMAGVAGGVSRVTGSLRARCLELVVELEAGLDFDEEVSDAAGGAGAPAGAAEAARAVREMTREIDAALAASRRNSVVNDEYVVAILGRPNAGKSSLINALIGSDRFIVTSAPGTTRDVNEASFVLNGEIRVRLLDTAGIRAVGGAGAGPAPGAAASAEEIERMGIRRSISAAKVADAIVYVVDINGGITEDDVAICAEHVGGEGSTARVLLALNKVDEYGRAGAGAAPGRLEVPAPMRHIVGGVSSIEISVGDAAEGRHRAENPHCVAVSAKESIGMDALQDKLAALFTDRGGGGEPSAGGGVEGAHSLLSVNQRQEEGLLRARDSLALALASIEDGLPSDFWIIDLRGAALSLGEVDGSEAELGEEVLDGVFSKFCIGK